MSENKTDRRNVVLGNATRRSMILELLKDGPLTSNQICGILGWPENTATQHTAYLHKKGKLRRESQRVASTREFLYAIRIDPEAYWIEHLTRDAYA